MKKDILIKSIGIIFLFFVSSHLYSQDSLLHLTREAGVVKFIVLPDTQNNSDLYPEVFDSQFDWIASNAPSVDFVLHVGDVVENSTQLPQWAVAKRNFDKLKNKVPYAFCLGNHDIHITQNTAVGATCDTRLTDAANSTFTNADFAGFGGAYAPGKIDNTYSFFNAGGYKWLVVCLEYLPNDLVIKWANDVISANPDCVTIIMEHAYMNYGSDTEACSLDTRMQLDNWRSWTAPYDNLTPQGTNNCGQNIWDKLVRKHKNIFAVFCGHILGTGTARLISYGDYNNKVYQIMGNYQNQVTNMNDNGKNGYLRIMTLDLNNNSLNVQTYSPYLNKFHPNMIKHNYKLGGVNLSTYIN